MFWHNTSGIGTPEQSELFSICIASRGNPLGLWATIHACKALHVDAEFLVFLNGTQKEEPHELLEARTNTRLFYVPSPVAPPIARDFLASEAKGDTLCFLDDHVIPVQGFFAPVQSDVLHCSYQPYFGYDRYYHFIPEPSLPTKGDYAKVPLAQAPYPCISGPHGGFFVKRDAWERIGGYGDWFQGFGGEEAYFGMKALKHGMSVMLDPARLFYHFSCRAETRGYGKTINHWNYEEGFRRLGQVELKEELWSVT